MTFDEAVHQAIVDADLGDEIHVHADSGETVSIIHWDGAGWYVSRLEGTIWHEYRADHIAALQATENLRWLPEQ